MSFLTELRQVETPSHRSRSAPLHQEWAPRRRPARSAATPHPFAKAMAIATLTYAIATTSLLLGIGPHLPSGMLAAGSIGGALAMLVVASLLPAVVTAMLVRQSRRAWGLARMAATYVPLFLLVAALQFGGSAAEAWWPLGAMPETTR
ncbi:MAG TPA: hypothetical protein VJ890_20515 [Vineibacter sp.]|nr:hypothetical protein [Vineibacter sp.]